MERWQIINRLVDEMGYKFYLEIGVGVLDCFDRVVAEKKVGVDPRIGKPYILSMTSDEFFDTDDGRYDIVFVDGDHRWQQAIRDVVNALTRLNKGGVVLLHDCIPRFGKDSGTQDITIRHWNGTVWLAFQLLRMTRPDLEMMTVTEDEGVGVIRFGSQPVFRMSAIDDLTYESHAARRDEILRPMEVNFFFDSVVRRWKSHAN